MMEQEYLHIEDQRGSRLNQCVCFLALAVPFLGVKFLISRLVVRKLALHFGLNAGKPRRKSSNLLNKDENIIQNNSNTLTSQTKYTKFDKFCESGNKFVWYAFIWTYGLIMHWNKPWMWDIESCWREFGNLPTLDVWCYGVFLTAYYSEACVMHFKGVRRKDFMMMLIHHMCVMGIIIVVWYYDLFQIGTLNMFLHDFSDVFIELAKCIKYLKLTVTGNVLFCLFVLSWLMTRMYLFPTWFVRSCIEDRYGVLRKLYIYYYWNGISFLLLGLHTIWTFMLLRAVVKAIRTGVAQDDRSEDESDNGDDLKTE